MRTNPKRICYTGDVGKAGRPPRSAFNAMPGGAAIGLAQAGGVRWLAAGGFGIQEDLEKLWSSLLSEDPPRIAAALKMLGQEERLALTRHLRAMVDAEGWSDGQRRRAKAALLVVEETAGTTRSPDA
ncbi:MAG TPA: hypothetical protein VJ123_06925 [Anaerolineales bacterium]|nr:hypothetical protein [Anaerolineales bacterium]